MTTGNAFGFLLLSAVMILVPTMNPAWFPPTGFDGTSTRAIWLLLNGFVVGGIGASYLISHVLVPALVRVASYRPESVRNGAMLPDASAQGSVV